MTKEELLTVIKEKCWELFEEHSKKNDEAFEKGDSKLGWFELGKSLQAHELFWFVWKLENEDHK